MPMKLSFSTPEGNKDNMKPEPVNRPKRPAIRWHGGKWRMAKWIMSHFPDDHDLYVEPFGGSAAVLLQKPRSRMEVYNDLDLQVFNFFTVLRRWPNQFIQELKLTPFHNEEYMRSLFTDDTAEGQATTKEWDEMEQARRFYIRAYQSIMGPTVTWTNSFKRQKVYSRGKSGKSSMKPSAHTFAEVDHLYIVADRLRGVTFENTNWWTILEKYDTERTLFYLDPPYLGSTRKQNTKNAYAHEMMEPENHFAFLTLARGLQGIPLISGYDSELYRTELEERDWTKVTYNARINGPNKAVECLWLSPKCQDLLRRQNVQFT